MEKTTVYLTVQQKAALARVADAQGRSEAHLIRAGIDTVTTGRRAAEARAPYVEGSPGSGSLDDLAAAGRPRWIGREAFILEVLRWPADASLRAELRDLAPGTTEDEPLP